MHWPCVYFAKILRYRATAVWWRQDRKSFIFSHFSLSLLFFSLLRVENVSLFEFILGIKNNILGLLHYDDMMIVKNEFAFVRVWTSPWVHVSSSCFRGLNTIHQQNFNEPVKKTTFLLWEMGQSVTKRKLESLVLLFSFLARDYYQMMTHLI